MKIDYSQPAKLRPVVAKLVNGKEYEKAEPILQNLLARYPDAVWVLTALGIVFRSTDRPYAAECCYRRALMIKEDNPEVCSNYGNLLVDMDRFDEALEYSKRAVDLDPDTYLFHKNYAVTCREAKQYDDAYEQYMWCHNERPDDPDLNFDIAYISMYQRELERAWDLFEWRFKTGKMNFPKEFTLPAWQGESLEGKKLLVLAEQGFGDTILMTRFLPVLQEMGAEVTLSCKAPLHKLFSGISGVKLITEGEIRQSDYDLHIAMMSIPQHLERDWLKWPKQPRFHIPAESEEKYKWIKNHSKDRLKVGIIWSGSVTFAGNEKRAVDLDRFIKMTARFPNVQFYSFQKGPREDDFAEHGISTITPLGHTLDDFSQTAAALREMDCIMMTDSAVCHLSGSLGVPVIDLMQYNPYWLYYPKSNTTPLYNSVRFVHQEKSGDWDQVFDDAAAILDNLQQERAEKPLSHERVLQVIDAHLPKDLWPDDKPPQKAAKSTQKKSAKKTDKKSSSKTKKKAAKSKRKKA